MEISSTTGRRIRLYELLPRLLGLAFTLVAAVLVGISKQTKTVSVTIAEGLPILHLPFTAKWHYMSAFVGGHRNHCPRRGTHTCSGERCVMCLMAFCHHLEAAIVLSLIGSFTFLLLVAVLVVYRTSN